MTLGTEVGLSLGDFVLDGDPAPSPNRGAAPSRIFGKFLLCPNGWMHHNNNNNNNNNNSWKIAGMAMAVRFVLI